MKSEEILNNVYFIKKGEFAGCFPVFLKYDKIKKMYSVLLLPDCQPIFISDSELNTYIQDKLIDFVEKIPEEVAKETLMEFNHRIIKK